MFEAERAKLAIDEARKDLRYFATDFPVDSLIRRFKEEAAEEGDIYIPDYQRSLQWKPEQSSYFIESCILRIPIPPLFFYEVDGRLEVVDGSQRLRTLRNYHDDVFPLVDLERMDFLNGFRFSDLPLAAARRLLNTPVRTFILEQGVDQGMRVELFRRLNTTAKHLTEAEIRKGAYRGLFLDLVLDCATRRPFLDLAPGTGTRNNQNPESERQELVTRFFIYLDHYKDFTHDVRRFLDNYMIDYNKEITHKEVVEKSDEFDRVMAFIDAQAPHAFFRTERTKQVPRVRFEAIAIGTALALRERADLRTTDWSWLLDPEFLQLVRTDASNSGPKLRARIEYVRDKLLSDA